MVGYSAGPDILGESNVFKEAHCVQNDGGDKFDYSSNPEKDKLHKLYLCAVKFGGKLNGTQAEKGRTFSFRDPSSMPKVIDYLCCTPSLHEVKMATKFSQLPSTTYKTMNFTRYSTGFRRKTENQRYYVFARSSIREVRKHPISA